MVTLSMLKDSNVQLKGTSANLVTSMDILPACFFKKQVTFKPKTPIAHQLQSEELYMQDDSIHGQSEELTSSNDSFCLQMKIQCVQAKP